MQFIHKTPVTSIIYKLIQAIYRGFINYVESKEQYFV